MLGSFRADVCHANAIGRVFVCRGVVGRLLDFSLVSLCWFLAYIPNEVLSRRDENSFALVFYQR